MPSQEEIEQQQELLRNHRKTLATLLNQQATHTEAFTPPATVDAILNARSAIRRIKEYLRSWQVAVEDSPIDEVETITNVSSAWAAPPHSAVSSGAPVYVENFAQGAKRWPIGVISDANKIIRTWVSDGTYRLELQNIGGYSTGIDSLIPETENFDLETSMRLLDGPQDAVYGINFGLNANSVYNVVFKKDGRYKLGMWSFVERRPEVMQNWAYPISDNTNDITTLRLRVSGKKARIYINGDDVLGQAVALGEAYSKGRIGIAVTIDKGSSATIEVLTFKVTLLGT